MTTTTPHRVTDLQAAAREWEQQHADRIKITYAQDGLIWRATATMPHPAAPELTLTLTPTHASGHQHEAREAACALVRATVDAHFLRPHDSAQHAAGLRRAIPYAPTPECLRHVAAVLAADGDGERTPGPGECASAALHVRMAYGIPEDELLVEHVVTGVREIRAAVAGAGPQGALL